MKHPALTIKKLGRRDRKFLGVAESTATLSNDPKRKVGAVTVDQHGNVQAIGYNHFPPGMAEDSRLHGPDKNDHMICAELNAIASNPNVRGSSLYIWPCPPCNRCTVMAIRVGVKRVFLPHPDPDHAVAGDRWEERFKQTLDFFHEVGVEVYCDTEKADW